MRATPDREAQHRSPHASWTARAALTEFRPQAILGVAAAAIVLGLAFDLWTTLSGHRSGLPLTAIGAGSFAVGVATLLLLRASVHAAVVAFGGGMTLVILAAVGQMPAYPVVTGFAPIVTLLGILFGWPGGVLGAVASSAIIVALATGASPAVTAPAAEVALGLVWVSALLGWLATRPIALALGWAWSSYRQALATTDLLRDRQAELTQLNRSLNDAYSRLEEANHELERARRAAVKARRLRDQFAATVSHEMRTPLNIITGFSEVMLMTPDAYYGERLPPSYAADIEAIHRNASHLSSLVDDILDLAQIEAEQLRLHKEAARVDTLVDEAAALVVGLFQAKGLTLAVEVPRNLPPVRVDRLRIRQIVINLLSNAARFTAEGGICIRAHADERDVVISVSDTGAGISPEYLRRIFEEFGQAEGGAPGRGVGGGSGLGLTISKRLAELHGGNLWAESTPGAGSTFSLSLPRAASVVAQTMRPDWEAWAMAPRAADAMPVVLVLADDRPVARILERHLTGYEVVAVLDAAEAAGIVTTRPPAVCVVVGTRAGRLRRDADRLRELTDRPVIQCRLRAGLGLDREFGVRAHLIKPVARPALAEALAGWSRRVRRCLVVDDEPEMVRLLARMLGALHPRWEVRTAIGGQDAIGQLGDWTPDLLFLDLLMPDIDGYAVLDHLRADARLRTIDVVVVSAHGREATTMVASEVRVDAPPGIRSASLVRYLTGALDALTTPADDTLPEPPEAAAG